MTGYIGIAAEVAERVADRDAAAVAVAVRELQDAMVKAAAVIAVREAGWIEGTDHAVAVAVARAMGDILILRGTAADVAERVARML